MAIIAPFRGLTYNFEKMGDLSRIVAPPYDVISDKEQEGYYRAHPNNVIRLILGKKKIGDSDWDNNYTRSADYLKRWESADILVRAEYPYMYLTSHAYNKGVEGGRKVRWGFIALARIEDEGAGVIIPHEKTFSAHKNDRLKLMRACGAQLSQVFGLYDDSDADIMGDIKKAAGGPPKVSFSFKDGTDSRMWVIRDQALFKKVADAMKDKAIFIADGHHRYETARNYRNIMRARHGRGRGDRSYEYIMMYLTDMNDEGLAILPSHRLIKRHREFEREIFLERARQWFEIDKLKSPDSGKEDICRYLKQELAERGRITSAVGFHCHNDHSYYILSLKSGVMDLMEKDLHPSLRSLDVEVLSRLIIQRGLEFTREDMDNETIFHYTSEMEDAVSLVDTGAYEMTFLLNPTRIEQVKEVASNSLIMPRKSTYFYPKVLTGLVFNKIDPRETINTP
jgi:uncharacterized protein (DUF1015 family)